MGFNMEYTKQVFSAKEGVKYDDGLRAYMLSVYNYMTIGLGITGLLAYAVANFPPLFNFIFGTPLQWVVMLAPLAMIFLVMPRMMGLSLGNAQMTFYVFAGLMGLSLSSLFAAFTGESIARALFVTASLFGSMSLYGYTTKKDLSAMGSFMIMGLIGIIIASLVNLFMQSSAMQFAISILSVIIFTGLTAYDTQRIKSIYYQVAGSSELASKVAIYGALSLYMDFINLFIQMLQLFGERK
ncbi:MAG: inhibitor (BI)/YccA family protein [Candidatus Midichloriaceae bacterium]|jgi:FtsH-binding integral membrane protein|nr:inhibitor (BI)/YccA family protein [Candidatus Midichloriaceae bacterium]